AADTIDLFESFPRMSGVVLAAPRDLGELAGWSNVLGAGTAARVAAAAQRGTPFAFGVKRAGAKAYVYVLVAERADQMDPLIAGRGRGVPPFEGEWRPTVH